jgi:mannose-6-phosphate isomerase-like protein (cupin superfamily)
MAQSHSGLTRRNLLSGGAASLAAVTAAITSIEALAQEGKAGQAVPGGAPAVADQSRDGQRPKRAIHVAAGEDRDAERRKILGAHPSRIDFKVSTADSGGGLFIIEHSDDHWGGPARHLHHEQEEWFFVTQGKYIIEVGEERFVLGPGDSVLAPRKIPHVWAFNGEGTGKLLIAFQPAGKMEAFFNKVTSLKEAPPREELEAFFRECGLQFVGPPLPAEPPANK